MIVRIWTSEVTDGREREYLQFSEARSAEMFRTQQGCLGVLSHARSLS
jgi:hypothetical protein